MFAITKCHSFDTETSCHLFKSEDKAKAYLHWVWEEYMNEEIENKSDLNEEFCVHEEDWAKIEWTDGEFTLFVLSEVSESDEEFDKIDWKRYL